MRVDDPDAQSELVLRDLDRQLEVGVVRDDDRDVALALEGIEQQKGRQIHVGALLFGLHHCNRAKASRRWVRERYADDVAEEVAVVDRETRNRLERTEGDLLPLPAYQDRRGGR